MILRLFGVFSYRLLLPHRGGGGGTYENWIGMLVSFFGFEIWPLFYFLRLLEIRVIFLICENRCHFLGGH